MCKLEKMEYVAVSALSALVCYIYTNSQKKDDTHISTSKKYTEKPNIDCKKNYVKQNISISPVKLQQNPNVNKICKKTQPQEIIINDKIILKQNVDGTYTDRSMEIIEQMIYDLVDNSI